jgi:transcription elongation factor Elf1
MDKNDYLVSVKQQKQQGVTTLYCHVCGKTGPSIIEMHHIFGRNNSQKTVPLCKNCHAKITYQQNKLAPKIRAANASRENNKRVVFVSMGGILKVIGEELICYGQNGDFSESDCSKGIYSEN